VGSLIRIPDTCSKRAALLKRLSSASGNEALIKAVGLGVAFHTSSEPLLIQFITPARMKLHTLAHYKSKESSKRMDSRF
jgi:hypothetical protein